MTQSKAALAAVIKTAMEYYMNSNNLAYRYENQVDVIVEEHLECLPDPPSILNENWCLGGDPQNAVRLVVNDKDEVVDLDRWAREIAAMPELCQWASRIIKQFNNVRSDPAVVDWEKAISELERCIGEFISE